MKKLVSGITFIALLAFTGEAMANSNTELTKPRTNNTNETQEVQKQKTTSSSYTFTLFNFFNSNENASKADTTSVQKKEEMLKPGSSN